MNRSTLAALFLIFVHTLAGAGENQPNIIFLLTDDQTVGAVGCYGNKDIITPNLDQLASEGIRFRNFYNTTAICMASRASVMTGLYEYRHGCNFGHGSLRRELFAQSYPLKLRQAGYFTGFAGKVGFVIENETFDRFADDFDLWAGGPDQTHYETAKNISIAKYAQKYPHCSRAYGAWAQDFIRSAKQQGKTFCMNISFKAPHLPFDPDPLDLALYPEGKTFPRPTNFGKDHAKHLSEQSQTSRAATAYREWINDYDSSLRKYYALITGVDAAVGMIREELQKQGLTHNTVIIFTSDNGYNCGAHGFGDKVLPYEEASKSPLIIFDPRHSSKSAGKFCDAVVGNVDLFPTICDLAGVPVSAKIDGKSLVPLLENPNDKIRDWLPLFNFWGEHSAQSMAVVSAEWKYIHWFYGGQSMKPREEFFQISRDRGEMINLAAQSPQIVASARNAYDREIAAMKATVSQGYGYEPYPILFDRSTPWESKQSLLPKTKPAKLKKARR
jgi:arylsulfatase A-like enzyme